MRVRARGNREGEVRQATVKTHCNLILARVRGVAGFDPDGSERY